MGGPAICGGQRHLCMDTFAICRLVIDGEEWASVEQYYQASKFADEAYRKAIQAVRPRRLGLQLSAAQHGTEVESMGNSEEHERDPSFRALENLYVASRIKFEQNLHLRKQLVETMGPIQAAATCGDAEWQLWNVRVLESVREELRPAPERHDELIEGLRLEFQRREDYDEESACDRPAAARMAFGAHQRVIVAAKMDGTCHDLFMHPNDTIEEARNQLAFLLGVAPSRIEMLHGMEVLQDASTVDGSGLQDGVVVSILLSSGRGEGGLECGIYDRSGRPLVIPYFECRCMSTSR